MTDSPGASALMPAGGSGDGEPRSVSVEQAYARLDHMRNSPDIQAALARGDRDLSAELKNLIAQTRTPSGVQINVAPDSTAAARESVADVWRGWGVPEDVLQQVRERRPVSADEYKRALALKKQFHGSKDWVRKLFDGDIEARRQSALISIILGSEIQR